MKNYDTTKPTLITRFLGAVVKAGNKLPDPILLFIYGTALIIILSTVLSLLGLSVADPRPEGAAGRSADGLIVTKNLLNMEGIRYILTRMVPNFVNFAPLGTVLVSFLAIGIAEKSGLIQALLSSLVRVTPKRLITIIVIFVGVMSNLASDVGYIVIIPLGAIIFYGFNKHPLAGLVAAFAGVSGGFSASLLLGPTDILLSGISQEASKFINPDYTVGPESNWYFMIASTFLIVIIGTFITEKIIEPMLGTFDKTSINEEDLPQELTQLSPIESRALKLVGLFTLVFIGLLFISVYPEDGVLLNQTTKTINASPFFASLVAFVFIYFSVAGIIYGFASKSFHSYKDVVKGMTTSMNHMAYYITIVFFMAQFINYFAYSNIGIILAITAAEFIQNVGVNGSLFLTSFIFITAFANLFIGSASSKWALLAPIFIPMFMILGYSPEVTQIAYRIGDSSTNIISPLLTYLPLIIVMAQKYQKDFGMGNLMALMLPYSISFLVIWSIMFYVWVFVFNFAIGPNISNFYNIIN